MKTLSKKEKRGIETNFTETTKGFLKLSDLVKSEPMPLAKQVCEGRVKSQDLGYRLNKMRSRR